MTICDSKKCTGCSACADACPKGCIDIRYDKDGFLRSYVNENQCVGCMQCISVCPANHPANNFPIRQAYKMRRLDNDAILKSTSGGVAALLSEQFIERGGVVCGCGFDDNLTLRHQFARAKEHLESFKGSKYVQSQTKGIYQSIKDLLKNGEKVLFIGTPCQVSGLRQFLKKDYTQLLTVDLVCHGVASQKVLNQYIMECRKQQQSIRNVLFRHKEQGYISCEKNDLILLHDDGEIAVSHKKGIVLWFALGVSLRESCYRCNFVSTNRCGDISLADYIGDNLTQDDRQYGASMVFVNTEKGSDVLAWLTDAEIECIQTEDATARYARLQHKTTPPKVRKRFFADWERLSLEQMEEKYILKRILPSKLTLYTLAAIRKMKKLVKVNR